MPAACTRKQPLGDSMMGATAAGAACAHAPAGRRRGAATVFFYPRVARWIAPGTAVHHILVFLCCLWWSLELADAVC